VVSVAVLEELDDPYGDTGGEASRWVALWSHLCCKFGKCLHWYGQVQLRPVLFLIQYKCTLYQLVYIFYRVVKKSNWVFLHPKECKVGN